MGNIISLDEKLKCTQQKQDAIIRKRKLLAVRKIFRCTHCVAKCEKCGVQISTENNPSVPEYWVPYNFCNSCSEEYVEFCNKHGFDRKTIERQELTAEERTALSVREAKERLEAHEKSERIKESHRRLRIWRGREKYFRKPLDNCYDF